MLWGCPGLFTNKFHMHSIPTQAVAVEQDIGQKSMQNERGDLHVCRQMKIAPCVASVCWVIAANIGMDIMGDCFSQVSFLPLQLC